jgi:hypothetical protein
MKLPVQSIAFIQNPSLVRVRQGARPGSNPAAWLISFKNTGYFRQMLLDAILIDLVENHEIHA